MACNCSDATIINKTNQNLQRLEINPSSGNNTIRFQRFMNFPLEGFYHILITYNSKWRFHHC